MKINENIVTILKQNIFNELSDVLSNISNGFNDIQFLSCNESNGFLRLQFGNISYLFDEEIINGKLCHCVEKFEDKKNSLKISCVQFVNLNGENSFKFYKLNDMKVENKNIFMNCDYVLLLNYDYSIAQDIDYVVWDIVKEWLVKNGR